MTDRILPVASSAYLPTTPGRSVADQVRTCRESIVDGASAIIHLAAKAGSCEAAQIPTYLLRIADAASEVQNNADWLRELTVAKADPREVTESGASAEYRRRSDAEAEEAAYARWQEGPVPPEAHASLDRAICNGIEAAAPTFSDQLVAAEVGGVDAQYGPYRIVNGRKLYPAISLLKSLGDDNEDFERAVTGH